VQSALHEAIVASVLFPAGVAVLPHALRILDRDCMAGRKSAGNGLRVLEAVVHPRLPMRRAVVPQMEAESQGEGEGDGQSADEEALDGLEEMDVEESARGVDSTSVESLHSVPPKEQEARKEVEQPPPAPTTEPKLPSFVARWDTISSSTIPSDDKITAAVKPTLTSPVKTQIPSSIAAAATTTTRSESRVNEIFNTGAWRTIQSNEGDAAEEEEEIPEIDMGFDSDEE